MSARHRKLSGKARVLHERRQAARGKLAQRKLYAAVPVAGLTIRATEGGNYAR